MIISSGGYGFQITTDQFETLDSKAYKITANVLVPNGFSETRISSYYTMNEAPYNGTCEFNPDPPSTGKNGVLATNAIFVHIYIFKVFFLFYIIFFISL